MRFPAAAISAGYRIETERWRITAGPGYELRRTSWHAAGDTLEVYREGGPTVLGDGCYAAFTLYREF